MARFGIKMRRRLKKASGSYHRDNPNLTRHKRQDKMGLGRSLGSAGSLILGGFLFYVALHYIPAYLGFQKVVALSQLDNSASRLADDDDMSVLSAYLDPFRIKRTYLRAGQSMQVQYALPAGAEMKIQINQCRPAFVVEIFSCEVVSKKVSYVKNDKNGTQRFQFKDAGFYLFDETIVQRTQTPQKYRVVWSRI